jgi:hypothetical protein
VRDKLEGGVVCGLNAAGSVEVQLSVGQLEVWRYFLFGLYWLCRVTVVVCFVRGNEPSRFREWNNFLAV